MKIMEGSEILVKRFSGQYFDENGNLTDEETRAALKEFLNAFATWVRENKK